jgi:hypothetical protein
MSDNNESAQPDAEWPPICPSAYATPEVAMTPRRIARGALGLAELVVGLIWMSLPVIIWLEVRAVRSMLEALIAQGVTP